MTAPDSVLWVLSRTRALLDQGWTQEGSTDAKGKGVTPLSHKAVTWDLYGALQRARQDFYDFLTEKDRVFGPGEVTDLVLRSEKAVTDLLGGRIAPWNDAPGRVGGQVRDLVTYAINVEQARIDDVAHQAIGMLTPGASMSKSLQEWVATAADRYHAVQVQAHETETLVWFRRGNQEAVVKVSYPEVGKSTCQVRMPYMGFMDLNDLIVHKNLCGVVEHFVSAVNWKLDEISQEKVALPANSK